MRARDFGLEGDAAAPGEAIAGTEPEDASGSEASERRSVPLETVVLPRKWILICDAFVAGFRHHEGMWPAVFQGLREGVALRLRREPLNPHDKDAVAILTKDGYKIGYLPRAVNSILAGFLDRNLPLLAVVTAADSNAKPWERVRVGFYLGLPEVTLYTTN